MKIVHLLSLSALLVLSGVAFSTTLNVPAEYTTIQAAIESATHGDEVIVEPSHYYEHVRLMGRNLVLRSIDPASPEVVARTGIDASGTGSVILASSGENRSCRVEGLILTKGTYGVWVSSSSPTVSLCQILENGDGLYASDSRPSYSCATGTGPLISRCIISRNKNGVTTYSKTYPVEIVSCMVSLNSEIGVFAKMSSVSLTGCTIAENSKGGVYAEEAASASLFQCHVASSGLFGVTVRVGTRGNASVGISDAVVRNNSGPGISAAGVLIHRLPGTSYATVSGCTITDNEGTGVRLSGPSSGQVLDCHIQGNEVGMEGEFADRVIAAMSRRWLDGSLPRTMPTRREGESIARDKSLSPTARS